MNDEPEILTKFIEMDGKPLFPSIINIRRGERVATYRLRKIIEPSQSSSGSETN